MPKITLFEHEVRGDWTFVPPDPPPPGSALPRDRGDRFLIINRELRDKNGNQRGSFVLLGTLVEVFSTAPNPNDLLMSFQGTNIITGKGVINTQGTVRVPGDFAHAVTFAIVGGTGKLKKARGTLTVDAGKFTYRMR